MADGALSIKLRCASWQQLATIYRRDLKSGTMFLKATAPPAIGTPVRIDLALPSATVIVLTGVVHRHVQDPQRGAGVELALSPIPAGSVWLIESALASEHRRRATPVHGTPVHAALSAASAAPGQAHAVPSSRSSASITAIPAVPAISDGADVTAAEQDLIKALVSEAESLKQLDPFLVLGVGYEATDREVRAAFGELTKRYHPDRFARYESSELRQVAEEIFILIRDAYRRLADPGARAQVLQSLDRPSPPPRAVPAPPRALTPVPPPPTSHRVPAAATAPLPISPASSPAIRPPVGPARRPMPTPPPTTPRPSLDASPLEDLIDQGRLDDALTAYKVMSKKYPHDRNLRAGVELCEGLRALAARDRLEAARRFESALEIDPSNERAARELADMRRQATSERKGLLSRLMGKEP